MKEFYSLQYRANKIGGISNFMKFNALSWSVGFLIRKRLFLSESYRLLDMLGSALVKLVFEIKLAIEFNFRQQSNSLSFLCNLVFIFRMLIRTHIRDITQTKTSIVL
jgi:hypothetical protein